MGMNTHVVAFKPPNKKWQEMKAVYDACKKANIAPPDEVAEFFDDKPPDENGVEIKPDGSWGREWSNGKGKQGFEIFIDKLPKDVTVVRFYNSW